MVKKSNSQSQNKIKTLESDYKKIVKDFQNTHNFIYQEHINPNKNITKFSLYQETPNSITSCNTKTSL